MQAGGTGFADVDWPSLQACDELIARLAHTVKVRQLLIRPTFNDYYKNVNSPIQVDQVTFAQFRNGLSTLGIKIDIIETELLQKRYAGKTPGYVNYVAFACDVDESERTFSTDAKTGLSGSHSPCVTP